MADVVGRKWSTPIHDQLQTEYAVRQFGVQIKATAEQLQLASDLMHRTMTRMKFRGYANAVSRMERGR